MSWFGFGSKDKSPAAVPLQEIKNSPGDGKSEKKDEKFVPLKVKWENYFDVLAGLSAYRVAIDEKFITKDQVEAAARSYNFIPPPFFQNKGFQVGVEAECDYAKLKELFNNRNAETAIKSKLFSWQQLKALKIPYIKCLLDNWNDWGKPMLEKNFSLQDFSWIPENSLQQVTIEKLNDVCALRKAGSPLTMAVAIVFKPNTPYECCVM